MEDSKYRPTPIGSSQINLDELQPLVERLAKNAHEVWAQQRMSEGWTLGPARDDREKKHPHLVPFEDLPASEQSIDRALVVQTLAAAIALGYDIRRANSDKNEGSSPGLNLPLASDDMDDSREIDFYQQQVANGNSSVRPLLDRLKLIQQNIQPAFQEADTTAISYQKKYNRTSLLSVIFGAITIWLGLMQLVKPFGPHYLLPASELLAGLATMTCVVVGKAERYKEKWLLGRFKAERLRLLKFRRLLNPSFWQDNTSISEVQIAESVDKIEGYAYPALEEWVSCVVTPGISNKSEATGFPQCWPEFVDYYCAKRLHAQMNYLELQESILERRENRTAMAGLTLFVSSIGFVLAHAVLDFGAIKAKPIWIKGLIAIAAALPAVAAAIRTYRSAREFGRNANRHLATRSTLREISERLHDRRSVSDSHGDIELCELVFEGDSREWLRLMKEAEWFG